MNNETPYCEAEEAGFSPNEPGGVFIMRGQSLTLSEFTITEYDDGRIESDGPTLSTSVHMAPYWLDAAVGHAIAAEVASHRTNAAWKRDDPEGQRSAIEAEMLASMQAITSAAFALDALHAALLQAQPTPELTRQAWRKNRTKRSRQMFETLRRAVKIDTKSQKGIKGFLDQISSFRDEAVHPPARSQPATRHPRLPVSIDPTFCKFRTRNAIAAVGYTLGLIQNVAGSKDARTPQVAERMSALLELLEPIIERWKSSNLPEIHKRLGSA